MIYGWFSNTDDYAGVRGVTKDDRAALRFDSHLPPRGSVVQLQVVRDKDEPIGDFPNTGIAYPKCLSAKAYTSLRSLIEPGGQFREASLDGARFFLFWPAVIVDCLDTHASVIARMPSGYQQLQVPKFKDCVISAGPVFLVPEFRTQVLFVNEVFVETVRQAGLHGIEFRRTMGDDADILQI